MASPLLGYNTNVRHHGKLFHIQTEDSGTTHAHIFTHLFADGGRIIATKKTTYARWIGTEKFPSVVKKLMQAQHKAMFIALRDGLFDQDEAQGARVFAAREIVLEDEAPTLPNPTASAASPAAVAPPKTPAEPPSRPEIDVETLERAAEGYAGGFNGDAPPAAAPARRASPSSTMAAVSSRGRLDPTPVAATPAAASSGKYQATQPATPRSTGKPSPSKQNESVFGADFLSEKSLDEVIMSYLAEDLDENE